MGRMERTEKAMYLTKIPTEAMYRAKIPAVAIYREAIFTNYQC